ncbi:MAG: alpha/beta hydrolase [Patescibacteria group bacterium]
MKKAFSAVLVALFLFTGCAGGPFDDTRLEDALAIGHKASLTPAWVQSQGFFLLVQSKFSNPDQPVRLYIEGDGFAYITSGRPAIDPTPHNPVALSLAAFDPSPNVAWIARPCQYAMLAATQRECPPKYWTTHRMAPEVVAALDEAVSALVKKSGSAQVELVGYSGGGAAAVLLAARRKDVVTLRTVAGNLDNAAFIKHHDLSPMPESLDAKDVFDRVRDVPQLHFVGSEDAIVLPSFSREFVARIGGNAKEIVVEGREHIRGWSESWPRLLQMPLPADKADSGCGIDKRKALDSV